MKYPVISWIFTFLFSGENKVLGEERYIVFRLCCTLGCRGVAKFGVVMLEDLEMCVVIVVAVVRM